MPILWGWVGTLKACPTMHLERLPITDQVREYLLRIENICLVRSESQKKPCLHIKQEYYVRTKIDIQWYNISRYCNVIG